MPNTIESLQNEVSELTLLLLQVAYVLKQPVSNEAGTETLRHLPAHAQRVMDARAAAEKSLARTRAELTKLRNKR